MAACAALDHLWQEVVACVDGAPQVCGDQPIPVLEGEIECASRGKDPAQLTRMSTADHLAWTSSAKVVHGDAIGDIEAPRDNIRRACQVRPDVLDAVSIGIAQGKGRTLGRECAGRGASNSAGRPVTRATFPRSVFMSILRYSRRYGNGS